MESFVQNLTFAIRALRRRPGFTAAAVLTLAASLVLNTSIFAQALQVVSVEPQPHALDVETSAVVRLTVDQGLHPPIVNPATVRVYGPRRFDVTGARRALHVEEFQIEHRPEAVYRVFGEVGKTRIA